MTAIRFSPGDQERATMEGWCLVESGLRGLEVQKDADFRIFSSDEAALCHVVKKARAGSKLHGKALRLVRADLLRRANWLRRP